LATEDAWYLPAFWFTPDTDLTIDVCTPPTFSGGTWSFVDLELDLFRAADGRAGIVDQGEWELLAESGLISEEVVRTADEAAETLLSLVEGRTEPFGSAALPWLHGLAD
jgi:predicted RNA-binding protein associated with RNAse of E/G family